MSRVCVLTIDEANESVRTGKLPKHDKHEHVSVKEAEKLLCEHRNDPRSFCYEVNLCYDDGQKRRGEYAIVFEHRQYALDWRVLGQTVQLTNTGGDAMTGNQYRNRREAINTTMAVVGVLAEIFPSQLSLFERGMGELTPEKIQRLGQALDELQTIKDRYRGVPVPMNDIDFVRQELLKKDRAKPPSPENAPSYFRREKIRERFDE